MSLQTLAHLCSKLKNASLLRQAQTNFPMSKQSLWACLAMQRQGLIENVTVGGKYAPNTMAFDDEVDSIADKLKNSPWLAYPNPQYRHDPDREAPNLPISPAQRRIWIGLKYYNGQPVVRDVKLISKPSRKAILSLHDLQSIVRGRRTSSKTKSVAVQPLKNPGETLYLQTAHGLLEARESIEKRLGGMVLFRVA